MHHQDLLRLERNWAQLTLERLVVVVLRVDVRLQIVQVHERLDTAVALVDLRPRRGRLAFLDLLQQLPVQRVPVDRSAVRRRRNDRVLHYDRRRCADGTADFRLLSAGWLVVLLEAGQVLFGSLFEGWFGERRRGGFLDLGFVDHDFKVAAVRDGGSRADGGCGAAGRGLRGGWLTVLMVIREWSWRDLSDDGGWRRRGIWIAVDVVGISVGFKVQVGGEGFGATVALVDAIFRVHFDDVVLEPGW